MTPGTFYTVFVPTNAAIVQAVKDGVLPGNTTTGVPKFTGLTESEKEKVSDFILYHILAKKSLIPNGKEPGPGGATYETLLKNAAGEVIAVNVFNQAGGMQVGDINNRKANVIASKSNNLSNRTIIHLIDNYLKPY
jgi:uncharacterized surface protein with fasciclin (FAS1) repeats